MYVCHTFPELQLKLTRALIFLKKTVILLTLTNFVSFSTLWHTMMESTPPVVNNSQHWCTLLAMITSLDRVLSQLPEYISFATRVHHYASKKISQNTLPVYIEFLSCPISLLLIIAFRIKVVIRKHAFMSNTVSPIIVLNILVQLQVLNHLQRWF